jgi:hypothetical protein
MANGDDNLHITFYRHGEVAVLLRPTGERLRQDLAERRPPDDQPPLDENTLNELAEVFKRVDVPLYDRGQGDRFAALRGADDRLRRVLPMQRDELLVLQTVNLHSWVPYPMTEPDLEAKARSISDVATAVREVNGWIGEEGRPLNADYHLVAVAPNWLATRFNS